MKTIEERAIEYAPDPFLAALERKAYIAGATEQKAIDEEVRLKKCDDMTKAEYDREVAFADWYNKNGKGTPTFSDAIEWARRELIDKAVVFLVDNRFFEHKASRCAKAFRKAMEEDNGQD